jgi:hypothetical protein
MPVDPALAGLLPQDRSFGLHGPALADIDFHNRASSNFAPNILSESGATDFVEGLVRLEAEAAAMISFWISVVPPKMDRASTLSAAVEFSSASGTPDVASVRVFRDPCGCMGPKAAALSRVIPDL